jgi:hypothetical protein
MLMTNHKAAKLSEPGSGSFYNPSAFVAEELESIFIAPSLIVLSLLRNQLNASPFEPFAERVGIVAAVGYDALRLLPRPTSEQRDADLRDRGF